MVFLGCNIWNVLNPDTQSMELQIFFVVAGFTVAGVGLLHLVVGLQKMVMVESLRRALQKWRHEGNPILPIAQNLMPGETYLLDRLNNREHLDKFLTTFVSAGHGIPSSGGGERAEIMKDSEFNDMARIVLGIRLGD